MDKTAPPLAGRSRQLSQWLCTLLSKHHQSPESNMTTQIIHSDDATRQAAKYAQLVQNGVNLRAIVAQMLRDIDSMRQSQSLDGDAINNHSVVLAYVSKLVSLTRLTTDREIAALDAIDRLANGEDVEVEVIPL